MNLVLLTRHLTMTSNLKLSLEGWVSLVLFLLAEILSLLTPLTAELLVIYRAHPKRHF